MKLTITEIKVFIFCLLNVLVINVCGAQNNPTLNALAVQDSLHKNNDEILTTPFGIFNLSEATGPVFRISGDVLRQTPGDHVYDALRGRVPGLRVTKTSNTPGANGYSISLNGGSPSILVDGYPVGLEVDLREVEEVIVLTDATFNSILGNLGDNGLIYIVTKGGKMGKPTVEVNYQSSLNSPTRLPKLLSASEYANVINQASNNDGLGNIYSAEAIAAYNNGSDPIRFPNVNRQDEYLDKTSKSNYASLNIYGGQDNVSYSAFVAYSDWEGLENVDEGNIDGRNLTFRTKINTKVSDLIQARASIYGKFRENKRPVIGPGSMFTIMNTTPANAFPLKVGDTAYVVSNQYTSNLLSELESGGIYTEYDATLVFNIGIDINLNKYIPGLTYSTSGMIRTSNGKALFTNNSPGLYTLENLQGSNGQDSLALKVQNFDAIDLDVGRTGADADIRKTFSYGGYLNYVKKMDQSKLNINLNHFLFYEPNIYSSQPDNRNLTFNLNTSYALKDKYMLFANLNASSSSKFIGKNRTNFFPTAGVAWVASNEDFLKNSKTIDFLKFRASYGEIGTEYTAETFYYLNTWSGGLNNSTIYLGNANTTQAEDFGYRLGNVANEAIDWVVYDQFFAGVQLNMFKKLRLDINYFNIDINNQVVKASALFADALGDDVFLPQINYTKRNNQGFNANIMLNDNIGDFKYYLGINAGYNKITGEQIAEIPYPDEYRLQQGDPEDNFIGYVSDGLFTADNIDSALPQFGDVKIGDIKYVDLNEDNVIDSRDRKAVGNTTPRFNYGINLGFEYKRFNLDVVGMGVGGYDVNLSGSSYYTHYGLGNYFASVNSNLPNGNVNPRLSTTKSINNYVNSDYWLVDGSHFRISNLEFGYTLPKSLMDRSLFSNVKLFLRGSNLALFSKFDDLDVEDLSAGVFEYPMMKSFVLGFSMDF
ncbi:MAG: SusC/RagA family TonB-linked outer membrane protein [Algibacter sp.]|uniref:SusC/RagA family TonB-linked outer membrane protein n=1 Tax=Algibacter sp. TaxID=1872428 RepID=UPI0032971E77